MVSSATHELLRRHDGADLLRFLTCGSVDDGKSTLIGRLLHDSKTLYEDQLSTLATDSRRQGSAGGALDYSLLLDGLKSEREQGITIDVAYRYFSTPRRKFIIADCPGHEQYTRNMVTGASTANLAIVLIDARTGVLAQTRRHSFIASLLDVGHVVVAINKMDLVDWSEARFEEIRADYVEFATRLQVRNLHFIPISALAGDNVVDGSTNMPWYRGTPLLDHLETVHIASDRNLIDLRFPVQLALRQDMSFRGFAGTVASGVLRPGAEVMVLPSRQRTRIREIVTHAGAVAEAFPPMAVTVTTEDELDISRGDLLAHPDNLPRVGQELDAILVWMSETALQPGRTYVVKHTSREVQAEITSIRYRFDINTLHRQPAVTLGLNEIGRVRVQTSRPIAFDPYRRNRTTGSFIVIDPATNATVGAGMILDQREGAAVERLSSADRAPGRGGVRPVTLEERAARLGQRPVAVWLTGGTAAELTPIARTLERRLFDAGHLALVIDDAAGPITARRAAEDARLALAGGLIAIVAVPVAGAELADAGPIVGDDRLLAHPVTPGDAALDATVTALVALLETRGALAAG